MGNFDLNNYLEVKDRLPELYKDHPEASIRTHIVSMDDRTVVFEARIYRTIEEATAGIYTSGFAREVAGQGMVNKTSHVENCETSAIGRALANLDYCGTLPNGKKAPRPSREEMRKADRPATNGTPGSGPATDKQIEFAQKLLRSSALNDQERSDGQKYLDSNRSKVAVSKLIDRLTATIEERKVEKAGAT